MIGLDGNVEQEAGIVSDKWMPHSEKVYSVTECYPDQITNGDLAWMLKHGYTQSAPRPGDE